MPVDKWISLGLHPWYLTAGNIASQLAFLEAHIGDENVRLIGECGFDRLRGPAMPVQRAAFERQVDLALAHRKPLIIHCVRAFDELQPVGKRYAHKIPMIVHGFNKSSELGEQLIRQGFFLSFGAAILDEASGAAKTLRQVNQPFFLETDDSGQGIEAIYEQAAFLRKVTVDELKDAIFAAWQQIQLI
ncbi:TatD DNase family protein [Parapedobacter koreensis]|uniref:TatD DNase family protein n=2 Tax=Parapedobacter koreensis TaxID=332977 RepID=A0A1H7J4H4_9SPHI|nr:TatD DNase family protein [Parapedobacter koreensis]